MDYEGEQALMGVFVTLVTFIGIMSAAVLGLLLQGWYRLVYDVSLKVLV